MIDKAVIDDAELDELTTNIRHDIEQNYDPVLDYNGDDGDEAWIAELTSAVGDVAEQIRDGIITESSDRVSENELREIVSVCVVWLAQIGEPTIGRTIREIVDHIKFVVPASKPFTADIRGRPLSRIVSGLAKIVDTVPAADSRGGPENYLVAVAGQTILWILELRAGNQP